MAENNKIHISDLNQKNPIRIKKIDF